MLKLFYITNNPRIAEIAEAAGVDRIFIDMEYIGKEKRQPNMNTVKNHHTVEDVRNIRSVLKASELLVRVNPIYSDSEKEINDVIEAGADVVMLPMWKTAKEVEQFISYVNSRAKTLLLLETEEARLCLDDVLKLEGIDEIHIGLNDLHLSQNKKNMFELLVDGVVDGIVEKIRKTDIPYGIGGIGAVGKKLAVPAEYVLTEHYRLGSSMVILARAFCNTDNVESLDEVRRIFTSDIKKNREYEEMLSIQSAEYFKLKHEDFKKLISKLVG